jgi:1-acyl-sn-glycerol-3-phosphate acyltransferase
VRRQPGPDWSFLSWHYKALHMQTWWHNRLFVRAKGREHLPREGGVVIAANHTSWWDPIALAASLPRPVNFLGKKEVFRSRFGRWFFGRGGVIPVDRKGSNPEAYAMAVQALRDGRVLGVFPEGTRHVGKLGPARTGAARLAMESGAPIVPVGIASDLFWPPGRKVPRVREDIYVNFGAPFYLKGDPTDAADRKRGTDEIMRTIAALLAEAQAARDRREKWRAP